MNRLSRPTRFWW